MNSRGIEELDKAALKALEATNYCTEHGLYHGQKYKSCTPQKRVLINLTKEEVEKPASVKIRKRKPKS